MKTKRKPNKINRMPTIEEFETYIQPHLNLAKRGYKTKYSIYLIFCTIVYVIDNGIKWRSVGNISLDNKTFIPKSTLYHHFSKWSKDIDNFSKILSYVSNHIKKIQHKRPKAKNYINIDGTHTRTTRKSEDAKYQGHKKAVTTNAIIVSDSYNNIIDIAGVFSGNINESHEDVSDCIERSLIKLKDNDVIDNNTQLNADSGYDSKYLRKKCKKLKIKINCPINKRNRKTKKVGRPLSFNPKTYAKRYPSEKVFSWMDNFYGTLVRHDIKTNHFIFKILIVAVLINLRFLVQ